MSFQRIHFEAILEELKDSITLNTLVPTNLEKAKNMNDYLVELLEDQRKKKEIVQDNTFKKLQRKILMICKV